MKKIRIWSVESGATGEPVARPVEELSNTETEGQLEDLLCHSPDVLMKNITLVGRQLPTGGGPLDLLGVDEDGRLVVFELKRGTLTREAVAQVIDYASDLAQMDADALHELIEGHSGHQGIDRIEDFGDWYSENFPSSTDVLASRPRMVLVGLGVDSRALRMVNYLAESGVDIQLLTFHAFQKSGALFLARQVESLPPSTPPVREAGTVTKQANLEALRHNAESLGVGAFLEEVASFVNAKLPAYQWPGKTRYSFSLTERTDQGTPSLRVYVVVSLNWQQEGALSIILPPRAIEAAGGALSAFREQFGHLIEHNEREQQLRISVTMDNWPSVAASMERVLEAMVAGWKAKERQELARDAEAETGIQ